MIFFVICIIAVQLLKKSHKCVGAFFVDSGVIINKGIFFEVEKSTIWRRRQEVNEM